MNATFVGVSETVLKNKMGILRGFCRKKNNGKKRFRRSLQKIR